MFNIADSKEELNQISLTGARSIILLGLLMTGPKSLEEIRQAFMSYKVFDESNSDDILRIDMNALKVMGCEISRASQKTGHRFIMSEHPFSLKITTDNVKIIKKIYGEIKKDADMRLLIKYHEFFKKIAEHVSNSEIKEALLGISDLRRYDVSLMKEVLTDCSQERTLDILYKSPASIKATRMTVIARKLAFKNDKVYLYCCDVGKKDPMFLNFDRIKEIIARRLQKEGAQTKLTTVRFKLNNVEAEKLSDEENILEASDGGFVVEGKYYNDFIAFQRILSFGSACTVLEPENFKNLIITKLKDMRRVYGK